MAVFVEFKKKIFLNFKNIKIKKNLGITKNLELEFKNLLNYFFNMSMKKNHPFFQILFFIIK
jgi:hypothetical protein